MTRLDEDNNPISIEADKPSFPPRVRGPLAITQVAVVTMESRRILEDQTVIVEDGVIRALAPSATIDVAGMQVIEGFGKYLMPGLADMHTHITDAGVLRLYLANGVTQVRNMEGLPFHLALAQMVERGALPGPRLFTVSPLIDGFGAQGLTARPRSLVLMDPAQAEAMAQRLVKRGYREMKAYQWLALDALGALGRAAAHVGVRMAGHCPDGITFEQAMAAGMGCFEHLTGIAAGHLRGGRQFPSLRDTASRLGNREAVEMVAHHLDFDAIRRLAGAMAAKEIWNCPTLVVWQKQNQDPGVALADPDLQYEHPGAVRAWEKFMKARYAALPCPHDEWLALARDRDEALAKVVTILHEEGAPLLLGTDAPNPFVVHGCSIHQELANLVRAGLSPYEALRCGTVEAARFLGESAISGSVMVGKRADLLLLRANPLLDVGAVRELEAVFVNGYHLTRADLDGLLEQHLASLAAPPPIHLPKFDDVENAEIVRQGRLRELVSEIPVGFVSYRHSRLPDDGYTSDSTIVSAPLLPSERLSFSVLPQWLSSQSAPVAASLLGIEHEAAQVAEMSAEPVSTSATEQSSERSVNWQVSIARPGEVSTQTYRVSDDGALLGLRDMLFGAPRELVAEPVPAEPR